MKRHVFLGYNILSITSHFHTDWSRRNRYTFNCR